MLIFQVDYGCVINFMVCISYLHDKLIWSELSITRWNLPVPRKRIFYLSNENLLIIEISAWLYKYYL